MSNRFVIESFPGESNEPLNQLKTPPTTVSKVWYGYRSTLLNCPKNKFSITYFHVLKYALLYKVQKIPHCDDCI